MWRGYQTSYIQLLREVSAMNVYRKDMRDFEERELCVYSCRGECSRHQVQGLLLALWHKESKCEYGIVSQSTLSFPPAMLLGIHGKTR